MVIQAPSTQIMDLDFQSQSRELEIVLRYHGVRNSSHAYACFYESEEEVSWQFTKLQQFTKVEEMKA